MLFKKQRLVAEGLIDIHAHILPGIDDGPATLDESVRMARVAASRGVSTIIATPHSYRLPSNGMELVRKRVNQLKEALDSEGIQLEVFPGVEYRASLELLEMRENGSLQTLADSPFVLIEMPFGEMPFYIEDLVFKLKLKGITPILAHPERTIAVQKEIERLGPLVMQGCLIQVNASSLERHFVQERNVAIKIIRNRWAFAIASDAHDISHRPPGLQNALNHAGRLLGEEDGLALVRDNPARIIGKTISDDKDESPSLLPKQEK